jgi:NADH-quinone oxidoreductase subunit N
MATGVKAAAFAALVRVLVEAFPSAQALWQPVIAGLAIASMVVGNLVALSQRSLKRMLAYSSIAHAGYLLVAVWPGTRMGAGAVLLYLVTYDDIAGLASSRPWVAFGLSICMLSLLGFPGTFGFIGKWYILSAVIAEGHVILPIVLVITSVISAGYYLPVIMAMYMKSAPDEEAHRAVRLWPTAAAAVAFSVAAILLFGVWPRGALDTALRSAGTITETAVPVAAESGKP